jgi:hypothetical protein
MWWQILAAECDLILFLRNRVKFTNPQNEELGAFPIGTHLAAIGQKGKKHYETDWEYSWLEKRNDLFIHLSDALATSTTTFPHNLSKEMPPGQGASLW